MQIIYIIKYIFVFVFFLKLILGNHFCGILVQRHYHEQFEKKIKDKNRVESSQKLVFSIKEYQKLEWEEEDEFVLNGMKYDVIKQGQLTNGTIAIYCFADKLETSLCNALEEDEQDNDGNKPSKKHPVEEFLALETIQFFNFKSSTIVVADFFSQIQLSGFFTPPLLPPERV